MGASRVFRVLVLVVLNASLAAAGTDRSSPSTKFLERFERLRTPSDARPHVGASQSNFGIDLVEVTEAGVSVTCALSGNLLFVNYSSALVIYDIANPGVPERLSYLDISENFWDIEIVGTNVFLAGSEGILTVVDASNPTGPVIVSETQFGPSAHDLEVEGDLLFLAGGWDPSRVIDISSPMSPVEIGTFDPSGTGAVDVAFEDEHLFVAMYGYGLRVYNVSNPSAPVLVGSLALPPYGIQQIAVSNGIAYAAGDGTMLLIDVSQPALPETISSLSFGGGCWDIEVAGNYAYVTNEYNGQPDFNVVDVSNIASPFIASTIPYASGFDIAKSGDRIAVSSYDRFTYLFDVSVPSAPTQQAVVESLGSMNSIESAGDWLAFPRHNNGLMLVERENSNIRYRMDGTHWELDSTFAASDGSFVLISGFDSVWSPDQQGLSIIDIQDPSNPVERSFLPTVSYGDIALHGSLAYLRDGELLVIDWSDPSSPQVIYSLAIGGGRYLNLEPPYLIVGGNTTTFDIVAVSTPTHPVSVSRTEFGYHVSDVEIAGGFAFVAGRRLGGSPLINGVWAYDLSNPAAPSELGSFTLAATPRSIQATWPHAYLNAQDGLHIIDISDPMSLVEVGFVNCGPLSGDVVVDPPFIYALSNSLMKFRADALSNIRRVGTPLQLLPGYPNPFNPTTTIRWSIGTHANIRVGIYNVRGTLVRTLQEGAMVPGEYSTTWDGQDRFGQDVASGVYFCRLSDGARSVAQKLVLLK